MNKSIFYSVKIYICIRVVVVGTLLIFYTRRKHIFLTSLK